MATAKRLWSNNAKGKLNAGIAAGDTTLTLQAGQGALFPGPTSGDWFNATLVDTSGNIEIIKVTTRSTDTFSVIVRAQEGTSAIAFLAGDKVELRITKGGLEGLVPLTGDVTMTGDLTLPNLAATGNVALGDNAADTFRVTSDVLTVSATLITPAVKVVATAAGLDPPITALGTNYSSSYTPTPAALGGNIAGFTVTTTSYFRVGNHVQVSGTLMCNHTSANSVTFEMDLPVASNLGAASDLGGSGAAQSSGTVQAAVNISGNPTNNKALFAYTSASTSADELISYSYGYRVI